MNPRHPSASVRLWASVVLTAAMLIHAAPARTAEKPAKRNYPYRELTGTAEEFSFHREWRSYYWREDFTLLVRDDAGKTHRVISREPTPWNQYRLGTTYAGLAVNWKSKPRVRVIGVQAIDRIPQEFPGLKLDPAKTTTAFILRVQTGKERDRPVWRDFYVNNWFHHWGDETDRKILPHYVNKDPHYTVYGYLSAKPVPLDAEGDKLLRKFEPDYSGIIYHGRIVKADNREGYALHLVHLLGRNKKSLNYAVYYGDAKELTELDGKPPPGTKKK